MDYVRDALLMHEIVLISIGTLKRKTVRRWIWVVHTNRKKPCKSFPRVSTVSYSTCTDSEDDTPNLEVVGEKHIMYNYYCALRGIQKPQSKFRYIVGSAIQRSFDIYVTISLWCLDLLVYLFTHWWSFVKALSVNRPRYMSRL